LKGWLVNSQYFFKAEEGRIDRGTQGQSDSKDKATVDR
jgi:hypothetical protein